MITENHEYYVSLEVAKLLKEAGFDWKCNGVFLSEDGIQYAFIKMDAACDSNNSKYNPYNISSPTLEVAQRWLRDVKNYDVFVVVDDSMEYAVCIFHNKEDEDDYYECYKTYEKAQESGIKKALELILEKGE
jgi:hypothetical protein